MKYLKKINQKGFTLIELLVVITILGILLGIGLICFSQNAVKAEKLVLKTNIVDIC